MLCSLTLRTEDRDAQDLGFLLHKHPDRVHEAELSFGTARVFYPVATERECTATLWVDVDPDKLAELKGFRRDAFSLAGHVNDRRWAASSLLSVALRTVYSTAMAGTLVSDPELPAQVLDLEATVAAVPASLAEARAMIEPLGWAVTASGDEAAPSITLRGRSTVQALLNQLYVLIPVLDGAKHYWVNEAEVDKLVERAGEWLADHPRREEILRRYLAGQGSYIRAARERLDAVDAASGAVEAQPVVETPPTPLRQLRLERVLAEVRRLRPRVVVDVGCGEGALLKPLLADPRIARVIGTDVSPAELARAEKRLRMDRMPERQAERLELLQSSITYADDRIAGADVVVMMEVIEHIDAHRLPAVEANLFGAARPDFVVLTTPNREYNALYPGLEPGALRHPDHRFELTRSELGAWVADVCERYGYVADLGEIGEADPTHGAPTQMVVLSRTFTEESR